MHAHILRCLVPFYVFTVWILVWEDSFVHWYLSVDVLTCCAFHLLIIEELPSRQVGLGSIQDQVALYSQGSPRNIECC